MAQISHADKEIKLKLVYYGPALSGKTTTLIYVHQVLLPNQTVKLFSINTGDDRTLFFDLLPLDLGKVDAFNLKLQLFTVPGQVRYDQTRRTVLNKADGVVFVADSQKNELQANRDSYQNLKDNLAANRIDYKSIPLILQFNKQDLDNIYTPTEMNQLFNERKAPSFGAIAVTGVGVLQTLKHGILQVLGDFGRSFPEFPIAEIEAKIDKSFEAVLESYQKVTRGPQAQAEAEPSLRDRLRNQAHNVKVKESRDNILPSELVEKAVETNIEMAELYNELNATKNVLEQRNRELAILGQITQALTEPFDVEQLPRMLFKSILMTFQTTQGAILEYLAEAKTLQEQLLSGFNRDPLAHILLAPGVSIAKHLFEQQKPFFYNVFSLDSMALPGKTRDELSEQFKKLKIMAFMSAPLRIGGQAYGLLNVYQLINESSVLKAFGQEELTFLTKLASSLSMAFERWQHNRKLLQFDDNIDQILTEQTEQLHETIEVLKAQNRDYQHRLQKLETILLPVLRLEQKRDQMVKLLNADLVKPVSALITASRVLDKVGVTHKENLDKFMEVLREETSRLQKGMASLQGVTVRYFEDADFTDETFAFKYLLDRIHEIYLPVIKMKHLEWRQSLPDDLPKLVADPAKLQYALNQLVENAIHFTPTGFIELKVQYNPIYNARFILVSVTDSGIGIIRNNLPKIFDRFFREDEDFGSERCSFGLGLTFCKEIIEHYGGRIWAKSEEGSGTTINVELPVQYA